MYSLPLRAIIVLVCCALLWFGFTGLKNGQVYVKGGCWINRADSPFNYWSSVIVHFVADCGGIGFVFFSR